jgi:hypothetical protein
MHALARSVMPGGRHPGAVHRHSGVVAGDVQLAEVAFGFRQCSEHRLFLRHVDPHRHDALVGAGQAMRRLLDRVLLDVGHDHVGAGVRKRGRYFGGSICSISARPSMASP